MENITISDNALMAEFESLRRQACGEEIGSQNESPAQAAQAEGWTVVRPGGENCPVLVAQDPAGRLWMIKYIDGPWAIEMGMGVGY